MSMFLVSCAVLGVGIGLTIGSIFNIFNEDSSEDNNG